MIMRHLASARMHCSASSGATEAILKFRSGERQSSMLTRPRFRKGRGSTIRTVQSFEESDELDILPLQSFHPWLVAPVPEDNRGLLGCARKPLSLPAPAAPVHLRHRADNL